MLCMTDYKFECKKCAYKTNIKSHFNMHITTKKHLFNAEHLNEQEINETPFDCNLCKMRFKTNSGLWKHKQKCNEENIKNITEHSYNTTTTTTQSHNAIHSYNTNSPSINIFLNDMCKDAINLDEFIKELRFNLDDLEPIYSNKNSGYVSAVVNIILKNLYKYSILKRPIHCINDTGSSIIHFKEENIWKKEDYNQEMPRINDFLSGIINQNVAKYNKVVGLKNINRFKFKKIKRNIIKNYKNVAINKKIVKKVSDHIITPSIPVI